MGAFGFWGLLGQVHGTYGSHPPANSRALSSVGSERPATGGKVTGSAPRAHLHCGRIRHGEFASGESVYGMTPLAESPTSPMKTTHYFRASVMARRPYLNEEWIEYVLNNPVCKETQSNGRIRRWGYIAEARKYLRVVTEPDGETVHTAFFDRRFKP